LPHLGLTVEPANDVPGSDGKGVVITGDPDGPAADQGLQTGDIILNVGGKAVANAGGLRKAIAEAKDKGRHALLMRVKTAETTRFVAVPFGKA
jgi:serine protease Do